MRTASGPVLITRGPAAIRMRVDSSPALYCDGPVVALCDMLTYLPGQFIVPNKKIKRKHDTINTKHVDSAVVAFRTCSTAAPPTDGSAVLQHARQVCSRACSSAVVTQRNRALSGNYFYWHSRLCGALKRLLSCISAVVAMDEAPQAIARATVASRREGDPLLSSRDDLFMLNHRTEPPPIRWPTAA